MSLSGFQRRRRELAAQAATAAEKTSEPVVEPLKEMTKAELTKYAVAKGIDLGKAKTNPEIITVIETFEKGRGHDANPAG